MNDTKRPRRCRSRSILLLGLGTVLGVFLVSGPAVAQSSSPEGQNSQETGPGYSGSGPPGPGYSGSGSPGPGYSGSGSPGPGYSGPGYSGSGAPGMESPYGSGYGRAGRSGQEAAQALTPDFSAILQGVDLTPLIAPLSPAEMNRGPVLRSAAERAFRSGHMPLALQYYFGHMVVEFDEADEALQEVAYSKLLRRPVWQVRWGVSMALRGDTELADLKPIRGEGDAGGPGQPGGSYAGQRPEMAQGSSPYGEPPSGYGEPPSGAGFPGGPSEMRSMAQAMQGRPGMQPAGRAGAEMSAAQMLDPESGEQLNRTLGLVEKVLREELKRRFSQGDFGPALPSLMASRAEPGAVAGQTNRASSAGGAQSGQAPGGSAPYGQAPGGSRQYGEAPGSAPYGQAPGGSPQYGEAPGSAPYGQAPGGSPQYGEAPGSAQYGQAPGSAQYGQAPGSAQYGQAPGGSRQRGLNSSAGDPTVGVPSSPNLSGIPEISANPELPMWIPGFVFLGEGHSDEMTKVANDHQLDLLLHFDVAVKQGRGDAVQHISSCRVVHVDSGKTLGVSKKIDSVEAWRLAEADRSTNREYVEGQLANLLEIIDSRVKVSPLPSLSAEIARRRVGSLISGSAARRLRTLAEIRAYQFQDLLGADQVQQAFDIAGGDDALMMLHGPAEQARKVVVEWAESKR